MEIILLGSRKKIRILDYLYNSAWKMSGEYLQGASKGELVDFNLFLKSTLKTLKKIMPESRIEFSSDQKTN